MSAETKYPIIFPHQMEAIFHINGLDQSSCTLYLSWCHLKIKDLFPILIAASARGFLPSFWRKHCRFTEDLSLEQKKSYRNLKNRRHKNKMRAFGITFCLWEVRLNLKRTIIFTWRNHRKKSMKKKLEIFYYQVSR